MCVRAGTVAFAGWIAFVLPASRQEGLRVVTRGRIGDRLSLKAASRRERRGGFGLSDLVRRGLSPSVDPSAIPRGYRVFPFRNGTRTPAGRGWTVPRAAAHTEPLGTPNPGAKRPSERRMKPSRRACGAVENAPCRCRQPLIGCGQKRSRGGGTGSRVIQDPVGSLAMLHAAGEPRAIAMPRRSIGGLSTGSADPQASMNPGARCDARTMVLADRPQPPGPDACASRHAGRGFPPTGESQPRLRVSRRALTLYPGRASVAVCSSNVPRASAWKWMCQRPSSNSSSATRSCRSALLIVTR